MSSVLPSSAAKIRNWLVCGIVRKTVHHVWQKQSGRRNCRKTKTKSNLETIPGMYPSHLSPPNRVLLATCSLQVSLSLTSWWRICSCPKCQPVALSFVANNHINLCLSRVRFQEDSWFPHWDVWGVFHWLLAAFFALLLSSSADAREIKDCPQRPNCILPRRQLSGWHSHGDRLGEQTKNLQMLKFQAHSLGSEREKSAVINLLSWWRKVVRTWIPFSLLFSTLMKWKQPHSCACSFAVEN